MIRDTTTIQIHHGTATKALCGPRSRHRSSARHRLKQEIHSKTTGLRAQTQLKLKTSGGRAAQQLLVKTSFFEMNAEDQALTGSGQGTTSSLLHSPALGARKLVSCSTHSFRVGEQTNSRVTVHLIEVNSP